MNAEERLYLELLENKDKVDPELVDVEFGDDAHATPAVEVLEERPESPIERLMDDAPPPAQPKLRDIMRPPQPPPQPPQPPPPQQQQPHLYEKQKLLLKFDSLREQTGRNIPEYTLDHDYGVMLQHYKLLVKQIKNDNKVTFYKKCLLAFSGGMEMFLGDLGAGLDMKGFTQYQADNISKYDKLLVKIGEKSYVPDAVSKLPVEVQLFLTIIFQTLIFLSTKLFKLGV